ncbi:MAG: hypothetical protein NTX45_22170 [Proteobacteria bacterium]|nr:hypothetical protein [Pseudomonadota bacterium]
MKRLFYALIGVLAGSALSWGIIFFLGYALEAVGIHLYQSEFDQQRNFNIFIISWLLSVIVGGWLGWRVGEPRD